MHDELLLLGNNTMLHWQVNTEKKTYIADNCGCPKFVQQLEDALYARDHLQISHHHHHHLHISHSIDDDNA